MKATFRPLVWTGPTTPAEQRRSRRAFKASWPSTLDLLDRELYYLDARTLVIEADFADGDIRLDGMPRANARQPVHPGVRIAFESMHGPLIYATDSCEFWQHNVRSIALGLEALRAVDRYGVTKRGEQYTGWKALPSGTSDVASDMTAAQALAVLRTYAPEHKGDESLERLIRWAKAGAHPDRHGGDRRGWDQVEQAVRLLAKAGSP